PARLYGVSSDGRRFTGLDHTEPGRRRAAQHLRKTGRRADRGRRRRGPAYYGMTPDGLVRDVDRSRDFTEISVTRWAADDDKPLLGICRGCQVANVALGGTLYRDIPKEHPGYNGIDHDLWGKFPRDYRAHTVAIAPQTRLASAIGETAPWVNSMHHQALRDVAPKL